MLEMRRCSKCRIEKPIEEFGRLQRYCRPCKSAYRRTYWLENQEAERARNKAAYHANKEANRARYARWAAENQERLSKKKRARHHATKHLTAPSARARAREWAKANPAKRARQHADRKAAEIRATPSWADRAKIDEIYALARRKTEETGVAWHVDHIVPLKSPLVCGLHWEANLQILRAEDNVQKGNRLLDDLVQAYRAAGGAVMAAA